MFLLVWIVIIWLSPSLLLAAGLLLTIGTLYRKFISKKPEDYPIIPKVTNTVIAHRCAVAALADNPDTRVPENTLSAIRAAKNVHGVSVIECDVRCTLDGVPVLYHDQIIGSHLECSKEDHLKGVEEFSYNQLKEMRFREHLCGKNTLNEYIPTFEEALVECKKLGLNLMIELKPQLAQKYCKLIVECIMKHEMQNNCYIASFDPLVLFHIRRAGKKQICTAFLFAACVIERIQREFRIQNKPIPPLLNSIISISAVKYLVDAVVHFIASPTILNILGHSIALAEYTYLSRYHVNKYKSHGITVGGWTFEKDSEHIQNTYYKEHQITLITDYPIPELVHASTSTEQ